MYGYWTRPSVQPTTYGQAMQQSELYDPKTSAVTKAYIGEATVGVGTGYADLQSIKAREAENKGFKISEEEYKNNPDLFSEGIQWHEGMTDESAKVLKEFNDAAVKRQRIIADASTAQSIVGFTAGFGAGIVEPKNLAVGAATTIATGGLAEVGVLGNTMRRLYQARKTALRARVAIGAVEGVGAGVAVEPSNRYSAKTLQQDYTMADSLFNIATSTAFGAGLPVATNAIGKAGPFMQAKIDKFRGRAMDVVAAEHDIATQQFVNSQRVDVSAVEAAETGKLVDKPIGEQIIAKKIDLTPDKYFDETALSAAKNQNSKSRDLLVYLTPDEFLSIAKAGFSKEKEARVKNLGESGQKFNDIPQISFENDGNGFAYVTGHEGRHRAMYLKEKGVANMPVVLRSTTMNAVDRPTIRWGELGKKSPDDFIAQGWTFPQKIRQQDGDAIVDFPIKLDEIVANSQKIDEANTATIQKHNATTVDPRNDTLIDYDAIDAADERKSIGQVEAEAQADAYLKEAQAEIQMMLDQEILNEADLKEYQDAIQELNSASTKDALEILHTCLTRG